VARERQIALGIGSRLVVLLEYKKEADEAALVAAFTQKRERAHAVSRETTLGSRLVYPV
jgi:hypothetical protein